MAVGCGGGVELHCSGAAPTLDNDVAPILHGCGSVECHAGVYQSAANARAFLVGQPTGECSDNRLRVAPGDPEHSYLMHKLTNANVCQGSPMPRRLDNKWTPLPAAELQTIYDWICTGAK